MEIPKEIEVTITLEWNEFKRKWLMFLGNMFLFDFNDCRPLHNEFQNPDFEKVNKYKLKLKHLGKEEGQNTITMVWDEVSKCWRMLKKGAFLHSYWNCGTVIKMFPKIDKNDPQNYDLIIKKT